MTEKKAIIIGAGPAGLTAAYELLKKTDIKPIIFERSKDIGGISKTVNYKGNGIDLGGHRFFSKSELVMDWWKNIFPIQGKAAKDDLILKREKKFSKEKNAPNPEKEDEVLLIRNRLSRIFYLRSFFEYPITLNLKTLKNLGFWRIFRIGFYYLKVKLFPIKPEKNLEDFFINRFGKELYVTFFKDYTEKVWGVSCQNILPEWGAQRIKGLSISKAILHFCKNILASDRNIAQKKTETSLIEYFLYPKFGPGQLWEKVASRIIEKGGELHLQKEVIGLETQNFQIRKVIFKDEKGEIREEKADYVFSTMSVKDLIKAMSKKVPENIQKIAGNLQYRDFITVGLLMKKLKIQNHTKQKTLHDIIPDNWIYIQERDVKVGRLQIFNNWSPYLVKDLENVWLGMEYFCNEKDELWQLSDEEMKNFAIKELAKIDIISEKDVIDSTVIRMPKTYPAYFGSYEKFNVIRDFTDKFSNLFLIGRNGMHRYNNQDHSMLTAMEAVRNIIQKKNDKSNIWSINAEKEYHEKK